MSELYMTPMTRRTQILFLLITALIVGSMMFIVHDVGSHAPISDGGSHYVTGLLAYDWLHAGKLSNPMHFGTEYFRQLPYIGLLLWPPLFYGLEMVAFSIFGPTINVALVLCTVIFIAGAVVLGQAAAKSGKSMLVACCIVVAVLTSSLIQDLQRNILIDGLVSVLSLAAIFQFAYYVISPSWRGAVITGLLTILAFYAKGNGMQVGIAFPLVALMLRRPGILIDRRTLAMGAACILITGPWLYLTAGLSAQGFLYSLTFTAAVELISAHMSNSFWAVPFLAPFALVGAVKVIRNVATSRDLSAPGTVFDVACFSTIVACLLFHTIIPAAGESRYMLTAVLAIVGLAASGVEALFGLFSKGSDSHVRTVQRASVAVAAVMGVQILIGLMSPLPDTPAGARTAAAEAMKALPAINRSVLISGDFNLETSVGPVLAGLDGASRASKEGIVVVRGSRAFAGGAYRNRDYVAKFQDEAAYAQELRRLGVPVIVTSTARPNEQWPHVAVIERVLAAKESEYVRTAVVPYTAAQQISVWRRKDELITPVDFDLITESNSFRQRVSSVVR